MRRRRRGRDQTGPFDALGFRFTIRSDEPELVEFFDRAFSLLRTDDEGAFAEYDARADGVWLEGELQCGCTGIVSQARQILWQMNQKAVDTARDDLLLFHAAAVAKGGRAVLLPADSGSGKSTLAAALVERGFDYLSDEIAAIDPQTGALLPYPKPISLKSGSFEVLSSLADRALRFDEAEWHHVPPTRTDRCRPTVLVFPRYRADASELLPLGRAEAAVELIGNSFNFLDDGARWLPVVGALVEASSTHRLLVDRLDVAVDRIEELLDGRA